MNEHKITAKVVIGVFNHRTALYVYMDLGVDKFEQPLSLNGWRLGDFASLRLTHFTYKLFIPMDLTRLQNRLIFLYFFYTINILA